MKKKILIIILFIILDQVIKLLITNTIGISGNKIGSLISLNYVENSGAAFGIFSTRIVLIALDVVIIIFVAQLLLSKKFLFEDTTKTGFALIIAGGVGNLIDRIFRGYVIDYIDISRIFDFPVFNFADICIVVGVIIVFITLLIKTVQAQEQQAEKE